MGLIASGLVVFEVLTLSPRDILPADAQDPSEYQVKAAFVYNFVRFVQWPSVASSQRGEPLTVCIMGEDPFHHAMEEVVSGKSLEGKTFEVRRVSKIPEARACSVLFISSSEEKHLSSILQGLKGTSVLTIGDSPGDAQQGCVINFLLEDRKVRFEVNANAAELANLKISSKLLNLAKVVWE